MLLGAQVAGRVPLDQRGVVDEDVGDADALDDRVERLAEGGLVGHVRGPADRVATGLGDGGHGGVDGRGRPGHDADGQALLGEPAGDGGPDAGTGSDDDGSWHDVVLSGRWRC